MKSTAHPDITAEDRKAVPALLDWFAHHARPLPWRIKRDPWKVWVSETMLQQTRVETVIPYFHRFLERFPNPESLANAPLDEALTLWQGLGYYGRCRNLHGAARRIVDEFSGIIPRQAALFRSLPGVGDYICAAVLSIVDNWPEPALDANLLRIGCRWFCLDTPPQAGASRRRIRELLTCLIPSKAAGDFNEALMDLGSILCLPRSPRCASCPLRDACRAHRNGRETEIPRLAVKKEKPVEERIVYLYCLANGSLLLRQRETRGIWGGLYELPHTNAIAARDGKEDWPISKMPALSSRLFGHWKQVFSHRIWQMEVRQVQLSATTAPVGWRICHPDELLQYALPSVMRRIIHQYLDSLERK